MSEDMPERMPGKMSGDMSERLRNNVRKNVRQNVRRYARKKNVARNARRNVRKNARKNVRIEAARGELEASGRGSLHGRWEIWGVSLTMQSAIQQFAERLEMETTIGIYIIYLNIFNIYVVFFPTSRQQILVAVKLRMALTTLRKRHLDWYENTTMEDMLEHCVETFLAIYGSDL